MEFSYVSHLVFENTVGRLIHTYFSVLTEVSTASRSLSTLSCGGWRAGEILGTLHGQAVLVFQIKGVQNEYH